MYRFSPIVKTLVWGTESWVLSGVPGQESVVSEGPQAGRKVTDLFPGPFPLLVKFIRSERDTSVQVHPDDALAAARHGASGKTEMWYVAGASEGAKLLCGLKAPLTPESFDRLVAADRITEVLAEHSVAPGDVFFLPPGRIHAIGGGCLLVEVQQASDITYRIYDYRRPGLDGKPRPLHLEQAREAIDYTVYPEYKLRYEPRQDAPVELVACPFFSTTLYDLTRRAEIGPRHSGPAPESPAFLALVGLAGEGVVRTAADETVLRPGEAVLIPAPEGMASVLPGDGGLRLLAVRPAGV